MTKHILVLALVCLLGLCGWARISGSWSTEIVVLPDPALRYTHLGLEYAVDSSWTISSWSEFTEDGFAAQSFGLTGMLGPAYIQGTMAFNPSSTEEVLVTFPDDCAPQTASVTLEAPAYMWTKGKAELSFLGTTFIARALHFAYPYAPGYAWPCCPPQTESYILFCLTGQAEHVSITGMFEDCCSGLTFAGALIQLTDLSLCCGITHEARLSFSKAGFEYVEFTAKSLFPLCCGITFDASITFTVDSKVASITPRFEGIGQVCVTLFADVVWDQELYLFEGIVIHGWRIRCELGDCAYLEMLTALDVEKVENALADSESESESPCEFKEEEAAQPVFQGEEFEYIKLGFCGPGCCGGVYSVDVAVYFQHAGTLFGITRVETAAEVPVMSNLYLLTSFALDAVAGDHVLSVGWDFRF